MFLSLRKNAMLKFIISHLIVCICVCSCNNEKRELNNVIKEWTNRTLILPVLKANINGRDTLCPQIFEQKYKILVYLDSLECMSCQLNFFDWKLLIDEVKRAYPNTSFLFYINSKNHNDIEILQRENHFHYPVFYDTQNLLNKINKLPPKKQFQTFLLDKNNKVLLIGNPIKNHKMWQLYKQMMTV